MDNHAVSMREIAEVLELPDHPLHRLTFNNSDLPNLPDPETTFNATCGGWDVSDPFLNHNVALAHERSDHGDKQISLPELDRSGNSQTCDIGGLPLDFAGAANSSKRNGIRFPRHAVKTLRDWLDAHIAHPYPSEEERIELETATGLKPSQVANWLANARRRRRASEKAKPDPGFSVSPGPRPTTMPMGIPVCEKSWEELNPLERWKNSPPEHEPASINDIVKAAANSDLQDDQNASSPSSLGMRPARSSNDSNVANVRAASVTTLETVGQSSSRSATNSARFSYGSSKSRASFGSFSSGLAGKRDRRRKRPAQPRKNSTMQKLRMFQCTFCTDSFTSKYDWTRHEKSLHLSLEKWICAPLGPIIVDPLTQARKCAYCSKHDPCQAHVEKHNHQQCEDKGVDARTFYRKDHLRQHLRLMHNVEMQSFMDDWNFTATNINSRCGFCAQRFTVWQDRVDHLSAHFKAGVRMTEWKGCRGLDPAIAALVTNAMPPFLIGIEAVSPMPFGAPTRATSLRISPGIAGESEMNSETAALGQLDMQPEFDKLGEHLDSTTPWETTTVKLGSFAKEMTQNGRILTDEMLQAHARCLVYGSDDTWNQTCADNAEWLDLFKKAHGLDFIPSTVGGSGLQIPEDLETYTDLGLRIPFDVQLKARNDAVGQRAEPIIRFPAEPTSIAQSQADRRGFEDLIHDSSVPRNDATLYSMPKLATSDGSAYLPRHRYQIPQNRQAEFETITGAWKDSGTIPPSVSGAAQSLECFNDLCMSAGEMMMAHNTDGVQNTMPWGAEDGMTHTALPNAFDWVPTTATRHSLSPSYDHFINTPFLSQPPSDMPSSLTSRAIEDSSLTDNSTVGLSFDGFDMDFDSLFEMPSPNISIEMGDADLGLSLPQIGEYH